MDNCSEAFSSENLYKDALRTADDLRASLELAATMLEVLERQIRSTDFKDANSVEHLANMAKDAAHDARQATEPG